MRRMIAALAVTAALVAVAALIILAPRSDGTPAVPTPSASVSEAPTPAPVPEPDPTVTAEPPPVPEPEPIPEPVLAIQASGSMVFERELDPPTFEGVYVLDDPAAGYHIDGSDTRFYLAHARSRGWGSPGNDWNALEIGQTVLVEGERFTVTEKWTASKDEGAVRAQSVWTLHDPNIVVLISCTPRGEGLTAVENTYVTLRKEATDG